MVFFMADFDKFDDPNYSSDADFGKGEQISELDGESVVDQAMQALGPVRPFLPHIIAAIVIIAIGLFAFDYFVASVLNVTVTVEDTEGKLLNDSKLKIFVVGNSQPIFESQGNSTYAIQLKPGSYRYEADAPGYAIKKSSFEVSAEQTNATIRLEQDIDVEIVNFEQSFPKSLFVGGSKQFEVHLKNNSNSSETVELLAESDLEEFDFVGLDTITISGNSTETVQIEIAVPASATVKDKKEGDEKSAVLRIKYTEEKGNADFVLYQNPSLEITLSDADFSAKARQNYNKDEDEISIKNNNDFPIEGLTLRVEITSATNNDPAQVLTWFQFTEIANQENPWYMEISSIPADTTIKKELQVVLPMTAKKEQDIKGNIILEAPFLSEPIKKTLTLDIKESAEFGLSLSLSPSSPIEIEWDSTLGKYEDKMLNLRVKNEGQLNLENIVFSIANSTVCSEDWLELIENSIDLLAAGETQELKLNASAPIAVRNQEISKYCNMRYRFDSPVVSGTYVEETEIGFAEIVPQPD